MRNNAKYRGTLLQIAALFCSNGFVLGTWGASVPYLAKHLGLTDPALGGVLLTFAVAGIAAMFVTPLLNRRFGNHRVAVLSGIGFAGMLPVALLAPNVVLAVVAILLFGIFHGAMDVALNAAAIDCEKQLARLILSRLHGCFSISAAAGGLFAGWLQNDGHWSHWEWVALAIVPLALLSPGLGQATAKSTSVPEAQPSPSPQIQPGYRIEALLPLALIAFFCLIGEGAMTDWLTKLMSELGVVPFWAAVVFSSFNCGMAVGRFSGDGIKRLLDDRPLVVGGCLLGAIGLATSVGFASATIAIPGMFVAGLGLANIVPVVFRKSSQTGSDASSALAFVTAFGYAGFLIGPPLIGFIAGQLTLGRAILVVVFGLLLAAALGCWIFKPSVISPQTPKS